MKKGKLLVLALMLLVTLTACSEKDMPTSTEIIFKIADSEDSFVVEQDNYANQPYWSRYPMTTKLNDGYYINGMSRLYYFDGETKEMMPLCNKPNCDHESLICNSDMSTGFSYNIYSYKDKLYTFHLTGSNVYLVEYSSDGSGEYKELFKVGETLSEYDNDDFISFNMTFCNDDVYVYSYYPYYIEKEITITRYSLTTGKGEIITSKEFKGVGEEDYLYLSCVRSYGKRVFYSLQTLDVENYGATEESTSGIFVYDSETKNTIQLFRGESVKSFFVNEETNEIYYYSTGIGMKKIALDKLGEATVLVVKAEENTQFADITFDGQYIYLENAVWSGWTMCSCILNVYDINANEINSILMSSPSLLDIGDENFLWSNGKWIDKSDIDIIDELLWND